ncbi:MAG: hypothetical protein A2Z75_00665 [Chloroflexi bacterium RBG_13_50_10]|nr:MAG: hypothetical protein A2Z75_00665 [Chloroflexi bacterium RBG_13_50_10]
MKVPVLQFLSKYGLIQLGASHELIVPGAVVTPKVAKRIAYLKDLLEGTNDEWPTELIEAKIPDEVVWENDLKGKVSLRIPGIITIGGGLKNATKGTFSVSEVHTRVFDKRRHDLQELNLCVKADKWRKEPGAKPLYKHVRHKLVVQSTWYASELTLDLKAPGGVDLSAEVPVHQIKVAGEGQSEWTSKTTLKIKGNDKVPFAIQAWEIK